MKKFAVAYMSNFENDLTIEFVEAVDEIAAIMQHSKIKIDWEESPPIPGQVLEDVKRAFFDGDANIDVKELPQ